MLDPAYTADPNPLTIASWVLAEAMGVFLLYAVIFGAGKNLPSDARALKIVVISGIGLALVALSAANLHGIGGGDVISTITLVVVSLLLCGFAVFRRSRNRRAQSWPKVQATVEEAEAREARTRSTHYFVAQFAYSYETNCEYYSGRFERTFESESQASEYAQALRGTKIPVSVNPERPEDSHVLDPPSLT